MSDAQAGAAPPPPNPPRGPKPRTRSRLSTLLAVLMALTLFTGLLGAWVESAVFNDRNFANRAVKLLDSAAVREALADEITEALVQNGPSQVASFQSVIRPVLADLMQTDAFKEIFRTAVRQAHQSLFTADGSDAVINLSQALGVLAGSLQISNPDVAQNIPTNLDQFFVDFSDEIRGLQLWQTAEDVNQLYTGMFAFSFVLGLAIIVVRKDLRRAIFKMGVAVAAAGLLLVGVAVLAPRVTAIFVSDPAISSAVSAAIEIFVGDLQVLGVWTIGYGVVAAALATASRPEHRAVDARVLWEGLRARALAWQPTTPAGLVLRAVLVIAAGLVLILQRSAVVPLLVAVVGAYVTYVGVTMLLTVVGRTPEQRVATTLAAQEREDVLLQRTRRPAVIATGAVLVVLVTALGLSATVFSRSRAAADDERRCNGHAELCDRPITEVAFPGTHNSMSVARDPGWLFAEQTNGIPAQLQDGIRALLVKTHYGIPAGVAPTGAELIVTDRAAEIAVDPTVAEAQLPPGSADRANQLASSASARIDPSRRDVYLCHVYCEYGATRFVTALTYIKQFLDSNPNEVIILFIGDYVSKDDTAKAFRDAGLFDRLYAYDPTRPAPTLGEMIDARQNIFMLSEFSDTPPPWNNPGYGLFQDTPFTFPNASDLYVQGAGPNPTSAVDTTPVDDTLTAPDTALPTGTTLTFGADWTGEASCKPNRGTPDSPMFQINHWVTPAGAAPTVAQAQEVNAYDVLMPRVQACMGERGRFPTIVGVNFYNVGDLFRVVDDLNGVEG